MRFDNRTQNNAFLGLHISGLPILDTRRTCRRQYTIPGIKAVEENKNYLSSPKKNFKRMRGKII